MNQPKKLITTNSELLRLDEEYSEAFDYVTVLLMGSMGAGKTNFLRTCPAPVVAHMFDPHGEQTLRKNTPISSRSIESGHIFADTRFQSSKCRDPFALWESHMERLEKAHFFKDIGTLAIDSYTTFNEALFNHVGENWMNWSNKIKEVVDALIQLPCHVVFTGHLEFVKDEDSGKLKHYLYTPGRVKHWLPAYWSEVYVLQSKPTGTKKKSIKTPEKYTTSASGEETGGGVVVDGMRYSVLTRPTGLYDARTRIGSNGIFAPEEVPNMQYLLKKAGFDNWQDKEDILKEVQNGKTKSSLD